MSSHAPTIDRRTMLRTSAAATAAVVAAPKLRRLPAATVSDEQPKQLVWDAHGHLTGTQGTPEEVIDYLLRHADRMGIDRLIVFLGFSRLHDPPPAQFRQDNDLVIRAVKHAPDRVFGFVYLNPNYVAESLAEIDRCVRDGPLVGIKLWVALRCNHANLDPIAERASQLTIPVLQHTYRRTLENLPGESSPSDLAELAGRHPEVSFIAAHTGNDWEQGIRAIRANKNVWAEICGSDPTAGMVEMAVRELGPERVIYGSDFGGRSFASQVAKVQGADIPEPAKRLILGGNIERILKPIFQAKGITT